MPNKDMRCWCLVIIYFLFAFGKSHGKEINIINPIDSVVLAGTLTIPESEIKAAIVLVSGSGQQNRDEEIFGHRPFKLLADSLSSSGYAVLRMDDRGIGGSGGDFNQTSMITKISDVKAALQLLHSKFPTSKTGIIGHSEGGSIAILTALNDTSCNFIVTLAAPAWQGDSIIMSQSRAISTALTGKWDNESTEREFLDIVKSDSPNMLAYTQLWALFSNTLGETINSPLIQNQLTAQIKAALTPWYREFVRYNPEDNIRLVHIPWLALNGDKDMQVLPENLTTIQNLNPLVTTMLLHGHNHLFQAESSGLITDYEKDGQSPSKVTIDCIISWLDNL